MNKFIMMGRLTKDPETRYTQGANMAVTKINIAVDRRFKKEGGASADFFQMTAFGKTAEFIEKYMRKGLRVLASGRVENNNYTKNGETVYSNQFIIEEIYFADTRKSEEQTEDDFVELEQSELEGLPFISK